MTQRRAVRGHQLIVDKSDRQSDFLSSLLYNLSGHDTSVPWLGGSDSDDETNYLAKGI